MHLLLGSRSSLFGGRSLSSSVGSGGFLGSWGGFSGGLGSGGSSIGGRSLGSRSSGGDLLSWGGSLGTGISSRSSSSTSGISSRSRSSRLSTACLLTTGLLACTASLGLTRSLLVVAGSSTGATRGAAHLGTDLADGLIGALRDGRGNNTSEADAEDGEEDDGSKVHVELCCAVVCVCVFACTCSSVGGLCLHSYTMPLTSTCVNGT